MKTALQIRNKVNKKWELGNRAKELAVLAMCDLSGDTIYAGGVFEVSNVDAVLHSWISKDIKLLNNLSWLFGRENVFVDKEVYGGRYKFTPEFYNIIKALREIKIHSDGSTLLSNNEAKVIFQVVPKHHVHKYNCGTYLFNKADMFVLEWLGATIV